MSILPGKDRRENKRSRIGINGILRREGGACRGNLRSELRLTYSAAGDSLIAAVAFFKSVRWLS